MRPSGKRFTSNRFFRVCSCRGASHHDPFTVKSELKTRGKLLDYLLPVVLALTAT